MGNLSRVWPLVTLLAGCAPTSSAQWSLMGPGWENEVEAVGSVSPSAAGNRLSFTYETRGNAAIADDEVDASLFVDLTSIPTVRPDQAPHLVAIDGSLTWVVGPSSGGLRPQDIPWAYTPGASNDPTLADVFMYWGVFAFSRPDPTATVTGLLTFTQFDQERAVGTLHLELDGTVPNLGGGPITSDVHFDVLR